MIIFDVSIPLAKQTVTWPGDEAVGISRSAALSNGDPYNLSRISMSAHAGTHVDAPSHFLPDGKNVESLDLSILCGDVSVIDLPGIKLIHGSDLDGISIPAGTRRLLIKTDNSRIPVNERGFFHRDFSALSESGAEYIIAKGIMLVGIDYLSIAPFDRPARIHELLLSKEVIILEGLNLEKIEPGSYELYCLPLRIEGCEGSPARTILVRREPRNGSLTST